MSLHLAFALAVMVPAASAPAPPPPIVRTDAGGAASRFLAAFNALDDQAFAGFFAEDVTMFFPAGPFPRDRIEGKEAVVGAFHRFFAMARERGMTRLAIEPADLRVQDLGDVAIVSFELRGSGNIGRRSIVMRRDGENWLIVHFHASSLAEAN